MQNRFPTDEQSLRNQVNLTRQMVLLALGADHPFYRQIDAAWRSENPDQMKNALADFDQLPDHEKNYAMGLDHQGELTGAD